MDYVLALVALLWVGSVLLLAFAMRGYYRARAHPGASQDAHVQRDVTDERAETQAFVDWHVGNTARAGLSGAGGVSATAVFGFGDAQADRFATDDQQPVSASPASPVRPATEREALVAKLRARVAADPESAQGVAQLVRALYLDQSNFRFETIAALGTEDRQLALQLIAEWLADPLAVDFWQAMYAAIDVTAPPALTVEKV